ncbi:MAG: hypothetical protein DCC88_06195 [Spirobacillus cienkowskii]|jgi:hypothetical protein|uniref:Lipoprotein n=1 Tax=Spirobacillus cienkowskii TaxID=495820 RepID=A0A369KX28_9BACT|nr:MAG: hypothetical protein DCC88_06195 [Spirobacillus cienkowskii]
MKSLGLMLLTISASAITTISCKNNSDTNKVLLLKEASFAFSRPVDTFNITAQVSCTSDPAYTDNNVTISNTSNIFFYAPNSECTISINNFTVDGKIFTPNDNNKILTVSFNSQVSPLVLQQNDKIITYKNGAEYKYAAMTFAENKFILNLYNLSELVVEKVAPNSIPMIEHQFSVNSIDPPTDPLFRIDIKELKYNGKAISRSFSLKANNLFSNYDKNKCKIVSAKPAGLADALAAYNNSSLGAPCPDLNEINNWDNFADNIQYIILATNEKASEFNSFLIITVAKQK